MADRTPRAAVAATLLLLGGLAAGCATTVPGRPEAAPAAAGSPAADPLAGFNPCTFAAPEFHALGLSAATTAPEKFNSQLACRFDPPDLGDDGVGIITYPTEGTGDIDYGPGSTTRPFTVGTHHVLEVRNVPQNVCAENIATGPHEMVSLQMTSSDSDTGCRILESILKVVEPKVPK